MRAARLVLGVGLLGVLVAAHPHADSQAQRASAGGGNWPGFRGPLRDGISTDTGLLTSWPAGGPPKVFTATGLGNGYSSVSVAGGRIFTVGDRREGQFVIALEEATGKQLWATRVGNRNDDGERGGTRTTPSVEGDLLWVVDTDGDVVCLETATGKERWRKNMPRDFGGRMMSSWAFSESPLIDGDRVVVTPGGPKAAMVAMEKTTGKEIWRASVMPKLGNSGNDGAGYSSIVISNGGGVKQYVQMMGRGLASFRASDGWFMWGFNRVANGIANITMPVVKDNYVFGSTGYDTGSVLMELSPGGEGRVTAKEKYFLDPGVLQNHHGGFVLLDGVLYGGHGQNNGFPIALDLASGKMLWGRARGAGNGSAAVTAADGMLYFRYESGVMALIEANPKAYTLKSSFQIPNVTMPSWSYPVITGGRLYLREQDALHVYNVKR
jgi:outer membrane protein assembly factor BamB